MYKNILQNIDNIAVWPVISFVIFFLFFLCLLWWVFTADRNVIDKLKNLPMEEGEKNSLSNAKPE
ncbi:MAG TPA: cbb3-type cytochrome c oxidase subunit 3 [Ohtaekwangia sp.]|uniref:cbb3-type cytochrome c oxidase subunit 3 n=1 Tax=Ohtaekwangia sp. TaxID=2066019 RepID=UPI002F936AFD